MYRDVLCLASLLVFITACSGDDLGVSDSDVQKNVPVSFSCSEQAMTRTTTTGLEDYINNFKLFGTKTNGAERQIVFYNYNVWYSSTISLSNTANWEYVAEKDSKPVTGVTIGYTQPIHYWDFSADKYTFYAVADDNGTSDFVYDDVNNKIKSYSFSTTMDKIKDNYTCPYFTDPTIINSSSYGETVSLSFYPYRSKIRVGFFTESWPIKNLTFDKVSNAGVFQTTASADLYLQGNFVTADDITVSYDDDKATFSSGLTAVNKYLNMGPLSNATKDADDNVINGSLGNSTVFTKPEGCDSEGFITIMPCDKTGPITISCNYTAADAKEHITAVIPASSAVIEPNHSYTYIFKITEKGNVLLMDVQVEDWVEATEVKTQWHNW